MDDLVAAHDQRKPPDVGRGDVDQRLLLRGVRHVLERRRGQEALIARYCVDLGDDLVELVLGSADLVEAGVVHFRPPSCHNTRPNTQGRQAALSRRNHYRCHCELAACSAATASASDTATIRRPGAGRRVRRARRGDVRPDGDRGFAVPCLASPERNSAGRIQNLAGSFTDPPTVRRRRPGPAHGGRSTTQPAPPRPQTGGRSSGRRAGSATPASRSRTNAPTHHSRCTAERISAAPSQPTTSR